MMLAGSILNQFHHPSVPCSVNDGSERKPKENELFGFLHKCRGIQEFKQIHSRYVKLGHDRKVEHAGALVKACALSDWGSIGYAHKVLDRIEDPGSYEFNTLIRGYVNEGSSPESAVSLYLRMQETGVNPDNFTFPFVVKACSRIGGIREGMQVHGHTFKFGLQGDVFVQSSLISMYGNCGDVESSVVVFELMGDQKDVASWSSLISAHARMGMWSECLKLFGRMRAEGRRADESTLVSVLTSCANLGALDVGRCAHCSLLRNTKELNVIMQTSLLDMYVKCGKLCSGMKIFHKMPRKNLWTHSAMISGLAMHGEGEKALRLFADMVEEGLKPDEAICVGVLTACSHAGLFAEGLRFFDRMRFEHGVEPTIQHYGCMVDLMCRAGELKQAYEFVENMPMEPDESIWRSLLSACKVHRDFELAEIASRNLLKLDTRKAGDYVLVSNIYSMANRWDEAARTRTKMIDEGFIQSPGFSRVEVNRKLHTFVSQDRSHVQSEEIYEMLHQMEWQLRFEGYSPDTSQVLHCIDEDKRRVLSAHSQKLAIAYALVSTNEGTPIRIVRNLRMCGDCHTYTKMISKIFDREIIVRECHRFHHFREGACSCRDHW